MMTPRDQAAAVIRRAAHQCGCSPDDVLGRSRSPAADLARVKAYRALADEYGWGVARIGRFFGRSKATVSEAVQSARSRGLSLREPGRVTADERALERLEDLEVFLRRVTGQHLAYPLRDRLKLPMWQALPLAIIVEAYPRVVSAESLCEQYEHACRSLRVGTGKPVTNSFVKVAVMNVRKRFDALGLPDPIVSVSPHGFRVADATHAWMVANFDLERGALAAGRG